MAKYLVTGGCGFIGSHLVRDLVSEGHDVIVIDDLSSGKKSNLDKKTKLVIADINDDKALGLITAQIDGCFHLAASPSVAQSVNEWSFTHKNNQTALVKIFERISRLREKIPVIYASSAAVYGNIKVPARENMVAAPSSAYGVDKLASEYQAKIAYNIHQIPNIGFRIFNVYGPGQDPSSPYSGVISIFLKNIRAGKPVNIYGKGTQMRDFIYIEDIVNALASNMECLRKTPEKYSGKVYNLCTGKAVSILELAETIGKILGQKIKYKFLPVRTGDIKISIGNPQKSKKELDFTARYNLEQGLKKMFENMSI